MPYITMSEIMALLQKSRVCGDRNRFRRVKRVLGIWIGANESAKYWLSVLNVLKNRGVSDIFNCIC